VTDFQLRNRITTALYEAIQPGEVEMRINFYVSAVRLEGVGPWKLTTVRIKDAALYFREDDGTPFTADGFTIVWWFRRKFAALDGTVNDANLLAALDAQEREDDANGKCCVPC
jgi:hypothetical protein